MTEGYLTILSCTPKAGRDAFGDPTLSLRTVELVLSVITQRQFDDALLCICDSLVVALWLVKDLILFYEYFHADNGAGLGASHQTGWTGVVARLMHLFGSSTADQFLEIGKLAAGVEVEPAK